MGESSLTGTISWWYDTSFDTLLIVSAMETGKILMMLESFPGAFYGIWSLSEDFSSKTQNLMFARCSKDDIAKSDE
ncbi:hypothetical protein TNCV_3633201 [Trichonephila clavipes]|nr:hypothetical protein TNCV_3633201 [Trichonephila clavipes]